MFIKRAFYSMKYRKGQNIALTIAYTLFFALTLAILLVYLSMSAQVDYLQKSLGCAVTMRTNVNNYSTPQLSIHYCDILQEDGDAFVDSPYVESYNKAGYIQTCLMENGLEPVVRDTNLGLYEYQTGNGTLLSRRQSRNSPSTLYSTRCRASGTKWTGKATAALRR